MRQTILASLFLISVAAAAHAATPSDSQPAAASSSTAADLKAASAGAVIAYNNNLHSVHEYVSTEMTKVYLDGDAGSIGARQTGFLGSAPATITPARITETKGLGLGSTLLNAMPEETEVVLQATVDRNGSVRDLHITKAAGVFLGAKVKEAVGEYRFQPAMADNMPVSSDVTITVKIRKPE